MTQPLFEVRPKMRLYVLASFVDVVLALVIAAGILFGSYMTLDFIESPPSYIAALLLFAFVMLGVHVWSSVRQARKIRISFFADSLSYVYLDSSGRHKILTTGSLAYTDIESIDVSRSPSDWLFGTGSIMVKTADSRNALFFRWKTPTVSHVSNPFEVRAQIDRILADASTPPASSEQSSQ